MEITVKTVNEEAYDCYLISIATVLNSIDKDYQMISAGYWGFKYIPLQERADGQIGNGVYPYVRRFVEGEKLFHGIELIISYKEGQGQKAKDSIDAFLKDNDLVVIVSDAYWCSWSTYYRKKHYNHCYLIYGEENGIYKCLDPYVNNLRFDASYEELFLDEACKYVLKITSEDRQLDREMVLDTLKKDVEYMCTHALVKQIQRMIRDVENCFSFDNEINGELEQKIISPLIENIRILIRNRQGYLLMLQYLNDLDYFEFDFSVEKAKQCINNWKKLRFILIKNIYHSTKKDIKEMILEVLENIHDSEQLFIDTFNKDIIANYY